MHKLFSHGERNNDKRSWPEKTRRIGFLGLSPILEVFNMGLQNADTLRWHVYEILTNDVQLLLLLAEILLG